MSTKCAVRDCVNMSDQGRFEGPLCYPCYSEHYIKWRDKVSIMRAALKAIKSIKDKANGGDWDEISEARAIAIEALVETA